MSDKLKILSGQAHPELSEKIASYLDIPLCAATVGTFPDGETMVKINENIRGHDLFIIQPTCPPTNQNIMELLITVDAAKRASAGRITAVMPFFGYARQDRKDQPRVPITAKLVANLLTAAGVDRVLTMDLHAGQIQGFFDIPVDHLYAAPVLINHIRKQEIDNLIVVSPDVGGIKMSHAYATALETDLAIVAKNRVSATEVEAMDLIGEVEGKNVILIDDITETSGTLTAAASLLRKRGAERVFAGVSHAILKEIGLERIKNSEIEKVFCTDSTPFCVGDKVEPLCVDELLGEAIRRIHLGQSVSSLFDI